MLSPPLVWMLVHSACEWSGNELISTCISTGRGGWLWLRRLVRESVMSRQVFFSSSGGGRDTTSPNTHTDAYTHTHAPSIPTLFNLVRHQRLPSLEPIKQNVIWASPPPPPLQVNSERTDLWKCLTFPCKTAPGSLSFLKPNQPKRFIFPLCLPPFYPPQSSALLVQTASPHRTPSYRRRASESWGYWDDKSSFSAGFAGGIFLTDDGWFLHAVLRESNGAMLGFLLAASVALERSPPFFFFLI